MLEGGPGIQSPGQQGSDNSSWSHEFHSLDKPSVWVSDSPYFYLGGFLPIRFAITLSAIWLYVARGMTFFFTKSVFSVYGRPSIIMCAYSSLIPANSCSCSGVAELRSTKAPVVGPVGTSVDVGFVVS